MKTKGISFALILLVGTLVTPIGFSYAQTSNPTIPTPPRALNATTISSSQIDLSWLPPLNDGGSTITGYKIESRVACTGNFILILSSATTALTSYSNTGLTNSTCYQYRVFALNAVGSSLSSNNATATTLQAPVSKHMPSAPTGLSVNALSNNALKLTWNAPSDLGGAPIIGYKIQRNGTTLVNNTGSAQTSYINIGLLAGHQQTYRVAAWNDVGLGLYSNNATGKTSNQTATDIDNLGQQVSNFVQQRNAFFKQQREETIKTILECNEKVRNVSPENRTPVKAECKDLLHALKEKHKDTRKQFQDEFKIFRETIKSQIKEAKEFKIIDKEDVKDFKKDLKEFEKETKKEEKEFKKEIKEIKKEIKKKIKEKSKKDKHHKEDND
ncbi:MAG: fibronectin type III domain-containing protein [Nitrosopumilaceae archaeon]